jgi:hypothetical protein
MISEYEKEQFRKHPLYEECRKFAQYLQDHPNYKEQFKPKEATSTTITINNKQVDFNHETK